MKVICIAGPSDAGKTTLVETLVPELAERGRVGTVKSIHHEIEVDTPGTDTHRHREAGAESVIGITPTLTFDLEDRGKENPPPEPDRSGVLEKRATVRADGTDAAEIPADPRELRALETALVRLERRGYAFVLVEGFTEAPLPTVLVGDRSPEEVGGEVIGRGEDGLDALVEAILEREDLELGRDR